MSKNRYSERKVGKIGSFKNFFGARMDVGNFRGRYEKGGAEPPVGHFQQGTNLNLILHILIYTSANFYKNINKSHTPVEF